MTKAMRLGIPKMRIEEAAAKNKRGLILISMVMK
jgi:hypothetical protein